MGLIKLIIMYNFLLSAVLIQGLLLDIDFSLLSTLYIVYTYI